MRVRLSESAVLCVCRIASSLCWSITDKIDHHPSISGPLLDNDLIGPSSAFKINNAITASVCLCAVRRVDHVSVDVRVNRYQRQQGLIPSATRSISVNSSVCQSLSADQRVVAEDHSTISGHWIVCSQWFLSSPLVTCVENQRQSYSSSELLSILREWVSVSRAAAVLCVCRIASSRRWSITD